MKPSTKEIGACRKHLSYGKEQQKEMHVMNVTQKIKLSNEKLRFLMTDSNFA